MRIRIDKNGLPRIRNDTGDDWHAYALVRHGGGGSWVLARNTTAAEATFVGITREPIKSGDKGALAINGVQRVRLVPGLDITNKNDVFLSDQAGYGTTEPPESGSSRIAASVGRLLDASDYASDGAYAGTVLVALDRSAAVEM